MRDLGFQLRGLDAALVRERLDAVSEAADVGGEVVVELAGCSEIREEFFVLCVCCFEVLKGAFAGEG